MDDEQLYALLVRIDGILRDTQIVVRKLGYLDRGADIGLPHEVRMISLAYSEPDEAQRPGVMPKGSGEVSDIRRQLKAACRQIRERA